MEIKTGYRPTNTDIRKNQPRDAKGARVYPSAEAISAKIKWSLRGQQERLLNGEVPAHFLGEEHLSPEGLLEKRLRVWKPEGRISQAVNTERELPFVVPPEYHPK